MQAGHNLYTWCSSTFLHSIESESFMKLSVDIIEVQTKIKQCLCTEKETTYSFLCLRWKTLRQREIMCAGSFTYAVWVWTSKDLDWQFYWKVLIQLFLSKTLQRMMMRDTKGKKISFRVVLIYFRPKNKYPSW